MMFYLDYKWAEKLKDDNEEYKWEREELGKREMNNITNFIVVVCDIWSHINE